MKRQSATKEALFKARTASAKIVHALRAQMAMNLALVALLAMVVSGCQKQIKTGEAFVVLKSGEVIYMADMEIICLPDNFKKQFDAWKNKGEIQTQSFIKESEGQINADLRALDSESNNIVREQRSIGTNLISKINEYIDQAKLGISKLKEEQLDDPKFYLFDTCGDISRKGDRPKRGGFSTDVQNSFLIKTADEQDSLTGMQKDWLKSHAANRSGYSHDYAWYFFYINIPRQMEGTPVESEVRSAAEKFKALELRKDQLAESPRKLRAEHSAKINQLKENLRNEFYELLKKAAASTVRTGSKGDFVVPGEAAYLYAQTQRDNGEKIGWLVPVDTKTQKIKLSLSNAASAGGRGDFDDFWMFRWSLAE